MVKKSIFVLVIKVLGAALSFFWVSTITNSLGAIDAGNYLLWISIITLMSSAGSFGLNNVVLKGVSIFEDEAKYSEMSALVHKSVFVILLATSLISFLGYQFQVQRFGYILSYQAYFLFALPFFTLTMMLSHAIQGAKGLYESMLVVGILQPVFLVSLVKLELFKHDLNNFSLLFAFVSILVFFIYYFIWLQKSRFHLSFSHPIKPLLASGGVLVIYQVFQQYNVAIGQLLLGFYELDREVAVFVVCIKVATLVNFITFAVNRVVAPDFAIFYKKGDLTKLRETFFKAKRLMLLGIAPLLGVVLIFPELILKFFGSEFIEYGYVLQILILQQLLIVYCGPSAYLLVMTGNEKVIRNQVVISSIFATIIGYYCIPVIGIYGAIWASLIAVLVSQGLNFFHLRKLLNINILKY